MHSTSVPHCYLCSAHHLLQRARLCHLRRIVHQHHTLYRYTPIFYPGHGSICSVVVVSVSFGQGCGWGYGLDSLSCFIILNYRALAAGGPQNTDAPACSEVRRSSKWVGRAEGHSASQTCVPFSFPLRILHHIYHTILGYSRVVWVFIATLCFWSALGIIVTRVRRSTSYLLNTSLTLSSLVDF